MKDAKQLLIETLSERATVNPSYSMRAFARDLGISPQQLSNVMNGQRGLSPLVADKVVKKLDLSEQQSVLFTESLKAQFSKSKTQKALAISRLSNLELSAQVKNLELDLFKTVSNWHHFALMELIKLARNTPGPEAWFAKKLGISLIEVELSLQRLEGLELISKTTTGWEVNQDVVIADKGVPSEAVKNFHRQMLDKSIQALSFQNSSERYGSSSTLPIKVKDVARAKKLIQDFRLAFDQEITDSETGEEIYGLSIQLFRLTNTIGETENEN